MTECKYYENKDNICNDTYDLSEGGINDQDLKDDDIEDDVNTELPLHRTCCHRGGRCVCCRA